MKSPNGVEPTKFEKDKESQYAIRCDPKYGPIITCYSYQTERYTDLLKITDKCYEKASSSYIDYFIFNSSQYRHIADSNQMNEFTVLDYEVYGIDYENRENINKLCKYPDIIREYKKFKYISEESFKPFEDDIELLNDLDAIRCEDSHIRLIISYYFLKNPSEFLPKTKIVDKQYDQYLREWLGNDYQWKLLYRASEHGYSAKSFHECCNYKGPTLIVIKSSKGWIFGGYTTQSWSRKGIYNDMIY